MSSKACAHKSTVFSCLQWHLMKKPQLPQGPAYMQAMYLTQPCIVRVGTRTRWCTSCGRSPEATRCQEANLDKSEGRAGKAVRIRRPLRQHVMVALASPTHRVAYRAATMLGAADAAACTIGAASFDSANPSARPCTETRSIQEKVRPEEERDRRSLSRKGALGWRDGGAACLRWHRSRRQKSGTSAEPGRRGRGRGPSWQCQRRRVRCGPPGRSGQRTTL